MALRNCKECGHQVSTRAKTCPHCGARIRRTSLVSVAFAVFVLVVVLGMIIGTGANAQNATLSNRIACVTENLLDQIIKAAVDDDRRAISWLLENGCLQTRAGIPVTVLNRTWTKAHVRAYLDDGRSVELWTVRENVRD